MSQPIKFFITTYTSLSHSAVIGMLSSMDVKYVYDVNPTEQEYSKFSAQGPYEAFEKIKDASERNHDMPISLEYGG